jgi:nitroreductase
MSGRGQSVLSVDEAIRGRRSVRAFLPDEVPETILRGALELAQLAPSNCNAQPWTPHVVSGEALARLRADLIDAGMREGRPNPDWPLDGQYSGVHRERQVDAAVQLYGAMGVGRRDLVARKLAHVRNFAFFDAPHAMFIFMSERFDTREASDVGMYAQTLMLALTARGVASCAQAALGLFPDIVRRHLGIAPSDRLLFGVSFGYEDMSASANASRVGRASIEDTVRFHR